MRRRAAGDFAVPFVLAVVAVLTRSAGAAAAGAAADASGAAGHAGPTLPLRCGRQALGAGAERRRRRLRRTARADHCLDAANTSACRRADLSMLM